MRKQKYVQTGRHTHTQTESVMLVFMLRTAPYKKIK